MTTEQHSKHHSRTVAIS